MNKFKLYIFDLDNTLTESKQPISIRMSRALSSLLTNGNCVAIISGANFKQFDIQLLSRLSKETPFQNLFLLPTNGTQLWCWRKNGWRCVFRESFPLSKKKKIIIFLKEIIQNMNLSPLKSYGPLFEDRETQITFSALGSYAPLLLKKRFDPTGKKRFKIKRILEKKFIDCEINVAGTTSIDITRKGINKASGIDRFLNYGKFNKKETLFIGDALFSGGNDFPVRRLKIKTKRVKSPQDTLSFIRKI